MRLRDFLTEDAIDLALGASTKDDALQGVVQLLRLDEPSSSTLCRMARRRENLGSTGVGRGIAIPHCRSNAVDTLRLAFGRTTTGLEYQAIDEQPVRFLFLIVAPPVEVSNEYLPVLGKIAQFAKEPDVPERLARITTPAELFALMEEKGV
jgi:mannitol/fructose-specific phosphotransferase system IIA component (Ntr-type)